MAKHPFDTFLPSGAIGEANYPPVFGSRSASISPSVVPPRTFPPYSYIPSNGQEGKSASPTPSPYPRSTSRSSSQHPDRSHVSQPPLTSMISQNGRPASPPFCRTSSGEESRAAQIHGWREYTKHLRENAQGERAHLEADRARMEEVMAEERALWDQERDFLKGRIAELESQVAVLFGHQNLQQEMLGSEASPGKKRMPQNGQQQPPSLSNSITSGSNGTLNAIPQESGRNADGSPFYAPASRNPSRTFEAPQRSDLRVDSLSVDKEIPFRITSKALRKSDFELRSPPIEKPSREGSMVGDSVDISLLQPELDGVPIKTSAISPSFVASVLSPHSSSSPSKPSSQISSPLTQRDTARSPDGLTRSGSQSKKSTLEVIAAPETHRLTMNAGHTPNHSIHKFDLGESGNATPTQDQHRTHYSSLVREEGERREDENIDPDPELRGPLGLKNDPPKDQLFLAALTNKLQEVKESGLLSPSETHVIHDDQRPSSNLASSNVPSEKKDLDEDSHDIEDDDDSKSGVDEAPILRVKASMNFGRPFGSL